MSENTQKIDKIYRLSDSTVNCYGFRLLTSGYQIEKFAINPVGYYMHDRDAGVLVKWENLQIAGDNIIGKPVINLSHSRARQTISEINSGFLSGASFGHFVVLESSDRKEDKLPGQIGLTITKWFNRECSLVDVPGNYNAHIQLFDKDNNPINLSNLSGSSVIVHRPTSISLYVPQQNQTPLVQTINLAEAAKQVSNLLSEAIADKIITAEQLPSLKENYQDKPEKLPDLLDILATNKCHMQLRSKTWDELDKSGELELFSKYDGTGYASKYLETFRKESSLPSLTAQEKDTAKAELIKRLTEMPLQELERCDHLEFLKENAPVVYAGKMQFEYDKEPLIVSELGLDREAVKAEAAKERLRYIEHLKTFTFNELDKRKLLEWLAVAAPEVYREKFKEAFGKYPKN